MVILKNLTQKIDLKLIVKVDDYLFKTDRNSLDVHTHRALFNHYIKVILPMKSLGGKFFPKIIQFEIWDYDEMNKMAEFHQDVSEQMNMLKNAGKCVR